jgi:hypothetical protein
MGVHEHEVRAKTDRLIAAVEALTEELRLTRSRKVYTVIVRDYEDCIFCAGIFSSEDAAEKERQRHGSADVFGCVINGKTDEPAFAVDSIGVDQIIRDAVSKVVVDDARRHGPISIASLKS